jgi:hypothetical protein
MPAVFIQPNTVFSLGNLSLSFSGAFNNYHPVLIANELACQSIHIRCAYFIDVAVACNCIQKLSRG